MERCPEYAMGKAREGDFRASILSMSIDLIILAAMTSFAVLILVFKTNVSLGIMGLCAGYVFSDLLSDEVVSFLYTNNPDQGNIPLISVVSISLIMLPALLILWRFKGKQAGRLIQHLVPAIGFSLLATLLIFTNLPIESYRYLHDESIIFQQFESLEVLIAVAVVGIAVVDIILHEGEHRRKYRKKHK